MKEGERDGERERALGGVRERGRGKENASERHRERATVWTT